jgi:hypothetical protein
MSATEVGLLSSSSESDEDSSFLCAKVGFGISVSGVMGARTVFATSNSSSESEVAELALCFLLPLIFASFL